MALSRQHLTDLKALQETLQRQLQDSPMISDGHRRHLAELLAACDREIRRLSPTSPKKRKS